MLIQGDCLEVLKTLPDDSIDLVLADPPYGCTACKWDSVIPIEPLFVELWRVAKPHCPVVLMGKEPFSSLLRMSQIKWFKYDWIWEKNRPTNYLQAKRQPMTKHEIVSVFGKGTLTYYPIKTAGKTISRNTSRAVSQCYPHRGDNPIITRTYTDRFPTTMLKGHRIEHAGRLNPTQKPVSLMEYLIKTYTTEGETVLDFCMGSGTTGVACVNLKRKFIGIEKDADQFKLAKTRLENLTEIRV